MRNGTGNEKDNVSERLYRIYADGNRDLLLMVRDIVTPQAPQLAGDFYKQMLEIKESEHYLSHQLVTERLHASLTKWIQTLFLPDDERSVCEHMKWQQHVGDVHARINVPLRLVNHGIRLLKEGIARLILESEMEPQHKYQGFILINDLLDFSSSLINERYLALRLANENDTHVVRMHMMNISLVVETERLRSRLFDWLRRTITDVYARSPEKRAEIQPIHSTDFGLWVTFKAELIYSANSELMEKLRDRLRVIQEDIDRVNGLIEIDSGEKLSSAIAALGESVSDTAWMLGDLSSQAYELEAGKDTLTRLFNRRFLTPVMQSILRTARTTSSPFSVLYCDLDDFKDINDQHGHEAGDEALVTFGNFLISNTRATDYVFRLGGDEFLIVVAGAEKGAGAMLARKIMEKLVHTPLKLKDGNSIPLRTSIGIAEYDGHPDYEHVLREADAALARAKEKGKSAISF